MRHEEPEAYQVGNIPFLGLTIWLDSRPLIPRPETEWWTEQLIQERLTHAAFAAEKSSDLLPTVGQTISSQTPHSFTASPSVLDVCAGSGAIGCAILKHVPGARVYFGEIDPAHEATILRNIRENGLDEERAEIRIGDLFEPFAGMRFDYIAANPPYIPEGRELPKSVEAFEPALALRAGTDGLKILRCMAPLLKKHLAPGGQAWIECDSPHAKAAQALFLAEGLQAIIRNDQYDRPRVLVVSLPT